MDFVRSHFPGPDIEVFPVSKLMPNSPNGEHCSTCRFRVELKLPPDVTFHVCHGAPPSVFMVPDGRRSEFPTVSTTDPNFWCGLYQKQPQQRRKRT